MGAEVGAQESSLEPGRLVQKWEPVLRLDSPRARLGSLCFLQGMMASRTWTNWQPFEVVFLIPGRLAHLGPPACLGPAHEGINNPGAWTLRPALHPGASGSFHTALCSRREGGRTRRDIRWCPVRPWDTRGQWPMPSWILQAGVGAGKDREGTAHSYDVSEVLPGGFASGRGRDGQLGRQATASRSCRRNTSWSPKEEACHHLSHSPVERRGEEWVAPQWGGGGCPGRQGRDSFVRLPSARLGPRPPHGLGGTRERG